MASIDLIPILTLASTLPISITLQTFGSFVCSQSGIKSDEPWLVESKTLCGLKRTTWFSATGRRQISFLPLPSSFFLLQELVVFYD